jgi:hypothetical protein
MLSDCWIAGQLVFKLMDLKIIVQGLKGPLWCIWPSTVLWEQQFRVKVNDIWQCAGACLLQQRQLLEVIKDTVLAQLAYKFPSQVMMECSYKFLFLSAFFRDIKYFSASKMFMWTFKCGFMNLLLGAGNWKFEKCLRPIGSGFRVWARVQRIAYYADKLFPPLDPDHRNSVW